MRFALIGGIPSARGKAIIFSDGDVFRPETWIAQGYTKFDVICIGGAGGNGGGWVNSSPEYNARALGGAGGGGGLMRVQGYLSALPTACPVIVGTGGSKGINGNHPSVVGYATDGGVSAFNGATCFASGGKAGKSADYSDFEGWFTGDPWQWSGAKGGEGGMGGSIVAGGGGAGGEGGSVAGDRPANYYFHIKDGENGSWDGTYGGGGGGGAGGVGHFDGTVLENPSVGGQGSYSLMDDSVTGIGDPISTDDEWTHTFIVPGGAGGGNVMELLSLPTQYGMSVGESADGGAGCVVMLLTHED